MDKFKNLIVLGPLIYAIHHLEEHTIFNFIEWKLQYFYHSAAALSTEAILATKKSLHLSSKNPLRFSDFNINIEYQKIYIDKSILM